MAYLRARSWRWGQARAPTLVSAVLHLRPSVRLRKVPPLTIFRLNLNSFSCRPGARVSGLNQSTKRGTPSSMRICKSTRTLSRSTQLRPNRRCPSSASCSSALAATMGRHSSPVYSLTSKRSPGKRRTAPALPTSTALSLRAPPSMLALSTRTQPVSWRMSTSQ